jgi:hypothetical protein
VWTPLRAIDLQHLRQLRALRTARIIHVVCNLLRTVGGDLIKPLDELCIAATLTNETGQDIAAIAPALVTVDAQHFELAD